MTTDNKTLADARPGGRVRLGDALPPLPYPNYPVSKTGLQNNAYTASQMWDYACAAMSAQPSPGGQDALATARELLAAEYDKAGERVFADRARKGQYDNDPDVHAILTALAARQPVGEPVIDYEDLLDQAKDLIHCGCSVNGAFEWLLEQLTDEETLAARQPSKQPDSVALGEATESCIEKGDRQLVGQEAVVTSHWRNGRLNHILYCSPMPDGVHRLYAAPPARAVDLSQFRDALVWAEDAADCSSHPDHKAYRFAFTELLGLIDSQAVGK